jgi:site-specific DNA-methyltransferase (adenine-specific)/adenine-specific DNA-methyltransferase
MTNNKNGYLKVKAEYELVYANKEPKASILTNTLEAPLQELRVFNEGNEWEDGWRNMLIFGDNLLALKSLYEDLKEGGPNYYGLRNKIKLIYIDPPFATRKDFMKDKEKAYHDKVIGSQFIEFLRKRLIFLREILSNDGSIYIHLDQKKGHYIKSIMDEIFHENNFQNEIIWERTPFAGSSKARAMKFPINHDSIFFYTKSDDYYFNKQYTSYSEEYKKRFKYQDDYGFYRKTLLKTYSKDTEIRLKSEGKFLEPEKEGAYPSYKQYIHESKGKQIEDIWLDVNLPNPMSSERVDYPTQKGEKLMERIINASSKKGDIVLDCFMGSGTTIVTAEKLGRKWIGMDCGKLSIHTTQKRLVELSSTVGSIEPDKRDAFERIDKESLKSNKGHFYVSEIAKVGQLDITNDFLFKLHNILKDIGIDEFGLVCPESKFHLDNFEEDEEGNKTIKIDHITYKISFIEPKSKPPKQKPLKAKTFVHYNAGVYDKENILNLHWEQYKEFVMKLFEVRKNEHTINGFKVDGYIGVHSAFIWNYPEKKNITIDQEYVNELHNYLKGKAGDRFYVIVPTQSVNFMQDEIKLGDTVYTFLKVPVSVLIRLIQSGELSSFKQPKSEDNVNEVIDAFGFDFVSQPQVKYTLHKQKKMNGMFETDQFTIKLSEFYSDGLLYSPEDFKNFETLSLVLIDLDFESDTFILDMHFWGKDLIKNETTPVEISIDAEKWKKERLAVIFIDEYGNEKKLVLDKKDFR